MDLDDEELKATRMMNGADRKGRVNKMEQDIEILEELKNIFLSLKYHGYINDLKKDISTDGVINAIENILKERQQDKEKIKELEEENEELISDNLDYQKTLDIFDKRTYRKKYLEERRKEEPNLLYPDADEIYKRYYKLKEENKDLKNLANNKQWISPCYVAQNYIPVSLVEEKIEELKNKSKYCSSDELREYSQQIQVLEELLREEK